MLVFLREFFTNETAFIRVARGLIGALAVGGGAELATALPPTGAHIVHGVEALALLFAMAMSPTQPTSNTTVTVVPQSPASPGIVPASPTASSVSAVAPKGN